MAQSLVIGDLNVTRTVETLRANESLISLSATGDIPGNLSKSIRLTGSTAIVATLPAANIAPLKNGSQFFIINNSSATATIAQSGGTTLSTLDAGIIALVTLLDNSTAAGVWSFAALNSSSTVITKFTQTFNATTSWGTASGGDYSMGVTVANHMKTANPEYTVYMTNGMNFDKIDGIDSSIDSAGNISISINETPDERFAGKVVVA